MLGCSIAEANRDMPRPTYTSGSERTRERTGRLEVMGYMHDYEKRKRHGTED